MISLLHLWQVMHSRGMTVSASCTKTRVCTTSSTHCSTPPYSYICSSLLFTVGVVSRVLIIKWCMHTLRYLWVRRSAHWCRTLDRPRRMYTCVQKTAMGNSRPLDYPSSKELASRCLCWMVSSVDTHMWTLLTSVRFGPMGVSAIFWVSVSLPIYREYTKLIWVPAYSPRASQ